MKAKIQIILLITSILYACNSSAPKESTSKLVIYNSKEIGWQIEIPTGYKALSQSRMEANEQKGKEAIEKIAAVEVGTSNLIKLVNFQRNQFNSFNATAEKFNIKTDGSYFKNHQLIKKLIYDTYTNQKIRVDTLSGNEIIDGQEIYTFRVKIYGPSGEILMNQIIYNQLIKGYDFGANINYNNPTDSAILMNAFKKSKFLK